MATPTGTTHSLLPTHPQPSNSTTKKKPSQLPLPSSNFSASRSQPLPSSLPSPSRQSPVRPQGHHSSSVRTNLNLPMGGERDIPPPLSSPSTVTTFQQAQGLNSTTHAGGILPSANFFRPLRAYQFSRPSSSGSGASSSNGLAIMAPDPGLFQLAPLTQQRSHSSENVSGSTHAPTSIAPESVGGAHAVLEPRNLKDEDLRRHFSTPKRMKHSREPLLPIGGRPHTTNINTNTPPHGHTAPFPRGISEMSLGSPKSGSSPVSPSSPSPARRMRTSFERVFRRGASLDESIHKSTTSAATPSEGRRTFEGKAPATTDDDDDVRNIFPLAPSSQLNYKDSTSIPPFTHDLTTQLPMSGSDRSFVSALPPHRPPLTGVPVRTAKGRVIRNYEKHPSRNKFFFRGRFLTGGDSPWAFVASLGLTLGITGVWFGTTCVWWWKNESPAVAAVGAYLCLITISTMLTTAMRDPGILPRNLDPEPPYPSTSPSDGSRIPLPRDLKVRHDTVRVKYCPSCRTYRPPRSSHCKMCDNCVDSCDHHCQWVNNCVGRRNYTSFFAFLLGAVITLILVIVTSALHIYFLTVREHIDLRRALVHGLGSTIAFSLSVLVVWPVAALLSYHMRLLLINVTTIEQIRNSAHKTLVPGAAPPNPFSHGTWRRNLCEILCRPAGFSWLDGNAVKTEDKREVNPGVVRDVERGLGPAEWERED